MSKQLSWSKGLSSILFWSIISAAFIGPGTVTTAAKAGATFKLDLLWALVFSIIATIILQEAAARITIASGKNLGQIIAIKFKGSAWWQWFLFLSIAFGCAAYQAGNMLGAISGLILFDAIDRNLGTILLGILCFILLWIGNYKTIAKLLGMVVALMGGVFIYVSFYTEYDLLTVISQAVIPHLPNDSSLLIIGLIGTTIVPYNLFLASGISKGQSVKEMRIGLITAIIIGGIISIAIMLVGTQVDGEFSFAALATALANQLGPWASIFFGLGLFAAGMSSSITSPLAAAVTGQSLLGKDQAKWSNQGRSFRLVWASVLSVGLLFGLLDIQPIPAIILAQAINGALLPIVAIFLLLVANDESILSAAYTNKTISNLLTLLIVGLSCFIGLNNIVKAVSRTLSIELVNNYFIWLVIASIAIVVALFYKIFIQKKSNSTVDKN